MAGENLMDYAGQAALAYSDALKQAQNTSNALMRQYGFVAPNATGDYTVEGAQGAFNPNTLFNATTGGLDQAKFDEALKNLSTGGTGILADITRSGATGEAEALQEVQGRLGEGIGGGLIGQRRQLAESMTSGQLGTAKGEFISSLAGGLAPIGGAWQGLQTAKAQTELANLQNQAAAGSIVAPETSTVAPAPTAATGYATKGTPGGKAPNNPRGGTLYRGPGGVEWQYRINGPTGKGWYKK